MDIHYNYSTKRTLITSRKMFSQEHAFHSSNLLTTLTLLTMSLCSTTYVGNYNNDIFIAEYSKLSPRLKISSTTNMVKNGRYKFQNLSENLKPYKQSHTTTTYIYFVNLLLLKSFDLLYAPQNGIYSRFHKKLIIWEHWRNKWKYNFRIRIV